MSAKLYGKLWIATKEELNDVLLREKVIQVRLKISTQNTFF